MAFLPFSVVSLKYSVISLNFKIDNLVLFSSQIKNVRTTYCAAIGTLAVRRGGDRINSLADRAINVKDRQSSAVDNNRGDMEELGSSNGESRE